MIVPSSLWERVKQQLHSEHQNEQGATYGGHYSTKRLKLDCKACQSVRNVPTAPPLHPQVWPSLHVDLSGPFEGRMFSIFMDKCSKWPVVVPVSSMSSTKIVGSLFASYRLPQQVVLENGPQFGSQDSQNS